MCYAPSYCHTVTLGQLCPAVQQGPVKVNCNRTGNTVKCGKVYHFPNPEQRPPESAQVT
jgi:hypothetical protein